MEDHRVIKEIIMDQEESLVGGQSVSGHSRPVSSFSVVNSEINSRPMSAFVLDSKNNTRPVSGASALDGNTNSRSSMGQDEMLRSR